MKKIEINILTIINIEALFLFLFFKTNFVNLILGIIMGFILINLTKRMKRNNVTKTLLLIISIPLFFLFIYKTSLFVKDNLLKDYSIFIIIISLFIISIFLAYKKYHTFIKITEILFYIIILTKIISFVLCVPLIKINYLTISTQIDYTIIFIALSILYLYKSIYYLTNYQINNKEMLICLINPLTIKLICTLVIGSKLSNIYNYPYVDYLKNIKYLDFIERMEGILSFEYLFCFIILISFLLLIIKALKKPI